MSAEKAYGSCYELKKELLNELHDGNINKEDWIRLDTYCTLMLNILEN